MATEYILGEKNGELYKLFFFRRAKNFVFGFPSAVINATVNDEGNKTSHSSGDTHITYHEDGWRHLRLKEVTGKKVSKLGSKPEPLNDITYQEEILMGKVNVERLDQTNKYFGSRNNSLVIPLVQGS